METATKLFAVSSSQFQNEVVSYSMSPPHLESSDGPVVGVQHQLCEGTGLGGSVPAVRAVHQHTHPRVQLFGHQCAALQHAPHVPQPPAGLHPAQPAAHAGAHQLAGFCQLGKRGPHHVDVVDGREVEFDVLVESLVFVAFARGTVGHGVYLRPGVHYGHVAYSLVGLTDGLKHLLILQAAGLEAREGLGTPSQGGLQDKSNNKKIITTANSIGNNLQNSKYSLGTSVGIPLPPSYHSHPVGPPLPHSWPPTPTQLAHHSHTVGPPLPHSWPTTPTQLAHHSHTVGPPLTLLLWR